MKGWIEIHVTSNSGEKKIRSYLVSNLRWIGAANKHSEAALQTVGDDFIVIVQENYDQLRKLIEAATQ